MLHGGPGGHLGGGLCGEGRRLLAATESLSTGGSPGDGIALGIGNGYNGIVKGRLNMRRAALDIFALAAAAEFYKKLDSCRGSRANTLLHVGALAAGTARNVVACAAELKCSFRFFDKADMPPVLDDVRRLIENTDAAFGTTGRLDVRSVYPPLVNDAKCVGRLGKLTELTKTDGRYTAEDFAFYLERVPGCMAWLGVRDEKHDSALHSDTFDFDETVMLTGAELFIKLADTGV